MTEILKRLKAIVLDVDGVLTDGGVWWGPDGVELKRFSYADIMGVSQAIKSGLMIALISGEDSALVDRFALKLGVADVHKGCKDKAGALRHFASRRGLSLSEIAYMGDDINDLDAMAIAGLAAAPPNAVHTVLNQAAFVSERAGGNGAVREFIDAVLTARGPKG